MRTSHYDLLSLKVVGKITKDNLLLYIKKIRTRYIDIKVYYRFLSDYTFALNTKLVKYIEPHNWLIKFKWQSFF